MVSVYCPFENLRWLYTLSVDEARERIFQVEGAEV